MIFIGELQQGAIGADGDDPQGDRLAASSQSSVGGVLQPAAAGNLHAQQGDALDGIGRENGGEPFGVVVGIQLGTADEGDVPADEALVEIAPGKGRAVGCQEEMGILEPGGVDRGQLDLDGPLGETVFAALSRPGGGGGAALSHVPHGGAGTSPAGGDGPGLFFGGQGGLFGHFGFYASGYLAVGLFAGYLADKLRFDRVVAPLLCFAVPI